MGPDFVELNGIDRSETTFPPCPKTQRKNPLTLLANERVSRKAAIVDPRRSWRIQKLPISSSIDTQRSRRGSPRKKKKKKKKKKKPKATMLKAERGRAEEARRKPRKRARNVEAEVEVEVKG